MTENKIEIMDELIAEMEKNQKELESEKPIDDIQIKAILADLNFCFIEIVKLFRAAGIFDQENTVKKKDTNLGLYS